MLDVRCEGEVECGVSKHIATGVKTGPKTEAADNLAHVCNLASLHPGWQQQQVQDTATTLHSQLRQGAAGQRAP